MSSDCAALPAKLLTLRQILSTSSPRAHRRAPAHTLLDGSMGIRMFISVARALSKKQGKLVLYGPQPLVKEVFNTVALGDIIPVQSAAAAALAAVLSQ